MRRARAAARLRAPSAPADPATRAVGDQRPGPCRVPAVRRGRPAGRVTMPAKRTRPPARPETLRPCPSCSRSVTIQLPATTESPKVAICTAPSGHRPPVPEHARAAGRGRPPRGAGRRRAASTSGTPTSASTSPVPYGARHPSSPDELRHEHQRQPAGSHGGAAVGALPERTAPARTDEVDSGNEPDAGPEAHQRARAESETERRGHQCDRVGARDDHQSCEADPPRADPVDQTPSGDLHGQVGDEQRRRQQTDRSQRDSVTRALDPRRSRRRWRCSTSRRPRARGRRRSWRGYVSATRAIVLSASRSSAADRELEVLVARVLELRVREPAQALDEHHHRGNAGARDLGGVVQRARRQAVGDARRPRGTPRRRGRSAPGRRGSARCSRSAPS